MNDDLPLIIALALCALGAIAVHVATHEPFPDECKTSYPVPYSTDDEDCAGHPSSPLNSRWY